MDELVAALKLLGRDAKLDDGRLTLDGCRVGVSIQEIRKREHYVCVATGKALLTAKSMAVYLVTEYLPKLRHREALHELVKELKAAGVGCFASMAGGLVLTSTTVEELKDHLKRAGEVCGG